MSAGAPPSAARASEIAHALIAHNLPGARGGVAAHLRRADRLATAIFERWAVMPPRWQAKHVRWALEVGLADLKPATRNAYWGTLRALLTALGRLEDWVPHLRGSWERRDGAAGGVADTGRRPHLPVRRRR